MNSVKRFAVGAGILIGALMFSGCATPSGGRQVAPMTENRVPNNSSSSSSSNTIGTDAQPGDNPDSRTILRLKSLAQGGRADNSPFVAGKTNIGQVKQKWGQPDKETSVSDGSYAMYHSKRSAFGYNKNGTIFDVRSYSKQVQSLTLSSVQTVLGPPQRTTKPTANQINEIYQVSSTYQLEFIINTDSNSVDHVSIFDAGAVQPNPNSSSPTSANVPIRGVIEGFYGKPWSDTARINMFRFMQKENLNTYVYAPKGDIYQRVDWRIPYPSAKLQQIKTLVSHAKQDHVHFVYSISPGMTGTSTSAVNKSITYSSPSDRKALEAKINQLRSIGVNTFMLSFDDIEKTLKPADKQVYGTDYAKAQMQVANQVYEYEKGKDPNFQLWFVPTHYYGLVDGPYWHTLRSMLNHNIQVIWTGKWVLNEKITGAQAKTVTKLFGRKPILWDNYPVNDYTYDKGKQHQLMLGPLQGRSATLTKDIAGYISNPMLQPYASKLALETISDYLQNPNHYHPKSAWNSAIEHLPGITDPTLFKVFAEFNTSSTLNPSGYSPIGAMTAAFQNASSSVQKQAAQKTLETEFQQLKKLPSTLPPTVTNKKLLHEIQPWLTKLGEEGEGGLDALTVMNHPSKQNKKQLGKEITLVTNSPFKTGTQIIRFMQWAENNSGS